MSLFVHNEEGDNYEAEINGVRFICQEVTPEYETTATALAEVYKKKLPQIVAFMLDDITAILGDISADALTEALGTPEIDLDRSIISYLEQTLDDSHIIDVEYGDNFEELYEVIIDG